MFRSLVALLVALTIAVQCESPAYAYSNDFSTAYQALAVTSSDELVEDLAKSLVEGIGIGVGTVLACYTVDGIATLFFPPAAAAASICPFIGAGTGTVAGGVQAVATAR